MQYTPEQLARRQSSRWTLVQMIVAPIQFVAFLVTGALVLRYLTTGEGYAAAHVAALVKVVLMVIITVTGMFWEYDVYGKYFLAPEFFWEDLVNGLSLVLHLAFLGVWLAGASEHTVMIVMLIALAMYVVNFVQFAWRGALSAKQRRAGSQASLKADR